MELNNGNFESEVLNSSIPVLVDFWASWCMPCKMIAPTIDELAGDFAGKVKIGKVNVDESRELAAKFGIQGIPTLLLFKGGQIAERIVGVQPKASIEDKLNAVCG